MAEPRPVTRLPLPLPLCSPLPLASLSLLSSVSLSPLLFLPSAHHYLGAGDTGGRLHIIEVPRNLRRKIANEENLLRIFYDRERERANYCRRRTELRKKKEAKEAASKHKSVSILAPTDEQATSLGSSAPSAQEEKAAEAALKAAEEKARQAEEEAAEKEYQRLLQQFKAQLAPEDRREGDAANSSK
jgi:hypothetical protein